MQTTKIVAPPQVFSLPRRVPLIGLEPHKASLHEPSCGSHLLPARGSQEHIGSKWGVTWTFVILLIILFLFFLPVAEMALLLGAPSFSCSKLIIAMSIANLRGVALGVNVLAVAPVV
jgi:hypothetical protein